LKKLLALIAFSVLLLVPVGAQQVYGNHPNLPCLPPGILNTNPTISEANLVSTNFCYADLGGGIPCPLGYFSGFIIDDLFQFIYPACVAAPGSFPDPTLAAQCQGAAVLLNNHCFAEVMQMVGGMLMEIDTWTLFVANIGVNPVITGLVVITMTGIAGQAAWFIHRRKKKILN